ncbi:wall associated protein, partial [Listeria welshimeri]|nr:wall associated protein [Listeria welshimeri]
VTGLDSLPRLLKFYGIANKRSQFMLDNNMKDELLVQGNVVFIRNPQKNAGKAYQSGNYDTADKMRLDALAIGRGKHCTFGYEPINFDSGNLLYNMEDAKWFDFDEEQTITRTYNSMAQGKDSPIGRNWTFNLADQLGFLEDGTVMLTRSDGGSVFFEKQPDGTFEIEED